jgi:hypothetical protein
MRNVTLPSSLVSVASPPLPDTADIVFPSLVEATVSQSLRLPPAFIRHSETAEALLDLPSLVPCNTPGLIHRFIEARDGVPTFLRPFLTPYTAAEYEERSAQLYLAPDGRGGFGIADGELISLFSYPKARLGNLLVGLARECGAQRLCCYDVDGRLVHLYQRHGFVEVRREPWNEHYAPQGWATDRFGHPDYVEMEVQR